MAKTKLKGEIIREHVFAACTTWDEYEKQVKEAYFLHKQDTASPEQPDPRNNAAVFADYLIKGELTDCPKPSATRFVRYAVQDYAEAIGAEDASIMLRIQHRYSHDEENDIYSFWPSGSRKPFSLRGEHIRAMKRQYSNPPLGEGLTQNHVAQAWGISLDLFKFIKTQLGWTKDQDEFTREEHATQVTEEMLRDREMRSRGELHRLAAKRQHERVKEDAKKWRSLKENIIDEVKEAFLEIPQPFIQSPRTIAQMQEGSRMLVLSPSDLHVGKLGLTGRSEDARKDVLQTSEYLCRLGLQYDAQSALLVLGNDWGHIDTPGKTTTAGTPQDSEPLRVVIRESVKAARDLIIQTMKMFENLTIRVIPSNHSYASDLWMIQVLTGMFADYVGLHVEDEDEDRQYLLYGKNLLGFEHGDGPKPSDLGPIMATEVPELWGQSLYRYWHTGHFHFLQEQDTGGVTMCQGPSLAPADRWHHKKGYTTSKNSNVAYLYDKEEGQIARFLAPKPRR